MTNIWCTRIVAIAVAFGCAGGTSVWAQGMQMPGKPAMMDKGKPQASMQTTAPPVLTRVVPTSYGYDLIGTGFGTDKSKLQVFEGATQLTPSVVISMTGDKIAVQSKPAGSIQHKVVVAGQASGMSFTHAASQAGGQAMGMQSDRPKAAMGQPVGGAKDPSGAAISSANLKENIDLKGLTGQNKDGSGIGGGSPGQSPQGGSAGMQKGGSGGLQGEKEQLTAGSGGIKTSQDRLKDAIGEKGPITGSNADTFGGSRINNKKGGGGTGNFAGGGKGKTSSGGLDDKAMGGAKGSPEEMRYEQQAGSDHYAKTENMNKGDREAYWKNEVTTQQMGSDPPPKEGSAGRPRDDTMGSSGQMTKQEASFQKRALDAKAGASGKGDGRTDQQAAGGSDGRMIQLDKAGGPDRGEKGVGTVSMEKALEINKVVNPVRQ